MKEIQLYPGNIYNYINENGTFELCIYICDTNLKNKVCVIPFDDYELGNEFPLEGFKKCAYPSKWKEITRNKIKKNLMIKGSYAAITFDEYVDLSNILLEKLSEKMLDTYKSLSKNRLKSKTKKYALTEDFYKYITWFEHKSNLQFGREIKKQPGILKYGIYYVEIGENIGTELHKLRPAVIFKKCQSATNPNDSSYLVIPITSQHTSSKYSFNTPIIVNGKINYIRLNDMRRVSIKRIVGPLYQTGTNKTIRLSKEDQAKLLSDFKAYYLDENE